MLREHALTNQEKLNVADLDYLVKKANRLGKNGREVVHVSEESDLDGNHIYYFVTGLPHEQRRDL